MARRARAMCAQGLDQQHADQFRLTADPGFGENRAQMRPRSGNAYAQGSGGLIHAAPAGQGGGKPGFRGREAKHFRQYLVIHGGA